LEKRRVDRHQLYADKEKVNQAGRCHRIEQSGQKPQFAADNGGQALLKIANVGQDAGVVDANGKEAFIAAAKTRQWDRERSVRMLA
jgi:hypothetical protein